MSLELLTGAEDVVYTLASPEQRPLVITGRGIASTFPTLKSSPCQGRETTFA